MGWSRSLPDSRWERNYAPSGNPYQEPPGKTWSGRFFRLPLNRSFVENGHTRRPAHTLEDYGLTIAVRLILPTVEIRTAK